MPTATRKRTFTPEDIYLLRRPFDPQVSPDGRSVAYAEMRYDRESNETHMSVWLAPFDGRSPARRFTWGKHDHSPRWSPDGRSLAFMSNRGEKNQIYIAPLDGGDPRQLTHEKHGVNEYAWAPDSRRIAYTSRSGEYKETKSKSAAEKSAPRVVRNLRYRLDGIGYFDERRLHIFVIGVENGGTKQITDGDWYDQQLAWSPDCRTIAFTSDREPERHQRQFRSDLWSVPSDGGRAKRLTRAKGNANFPVYSPDGRWIAFAGHENGLDMAKQSHLYIIPAGGGAAPRSLSATIDRAPSPMPGGCAWAPDSKSVYFTALDSGAMSIYRAWLKDGTCTLALGGQRQIQAFSLAPDGKRVAIMASFASVPHEIYAATLNNGVRERNLSRANDDLRAGIELGATKRVTSRTEDGTETESFVVYPPDYKSGKRYPLVLSIHGGPHGMHPQSGFGFQEQAWAGAGYVVLMPNPRGSGGYGETFQMACVNDWGGGDYDDLMAAVDALVRKGVADPDRLYVGGYSYGGFMTTWVVGHTQRFKAALIGAPVSDHISMFGTSDIPMFTEHEIGGTLHGNRDEWTARSPLTHLPGCNTPVLIEHWEGDLRCPITQAEEIFATLKRNGCEVEFLRYPGGFHGFDTHSPAQHVDSVTRSLAWFNRHGGKPRAKPARHTKGRKVKASANGAHANGAKAAKRRAPARA